MEDQKKKRCFHQSKSYSEGSEICSTAECKVCNDGKWQATDEARSRESTPSLAYFYH